MDNMFSTVLVFLAGIILAVIGAGHLVMDFRHFDAIAKQCEEQGHIQNKTVRIKCQKEAP